MATAPAYRAVGQRVLTALTRENNMNRKVFLPSQRAVTVCAVLVAHIAMANPVVCSPGYYDATCNGKIAAAYQTPPSCSTGPGWTTVTSAQWIGSQYSAPQCSYQAPPSCPANWVTAVGPSWNGSSWVGEVCQPPAAPGPDTCQYGFSSGPSWNGSSWVYTCNSAPAIPTIVSVTGFWVWADCGSWNQAQTTGPIPIAVYQNNWSNGSVTYFQYYFGKQYAVSVDSKGRYYEVSHGDNWDTYPDGSLYPLSSLFEVTGGYPGASMPAQPAYMCTHSAGHN